MINIDSVEKSKPNLEIDLFIKSRIDSFVLKLKNKTKRQFYLKSFSRWLKWCNNLKHQLKKYDIYIDRKKINPYNAINIIFKQLPKNKITVIGNGVSVVGSFQIAQIKKEI